MCQKNQSRLPTLEMISLTQILYYKGESTLQKGRDCCHIILFFNGTMFEL